MRILGSQRQHALDRAAKQPARAQEKLLLDIVGKNRDTEYGRKHLFSSIRGSRDFKQCVPVVEYGDIEPYIEKMKDGQCNILTRDPTFMFSLTSGTTARPKFIPITRVGQRRTEALMRQWFSCAICDHPSVLDQKFFGVTGAAVEGYCPSGIPYGSASGMIHTTLPGVIKKTFAVPLAASSIADYELRYYLMARFAFEQSVSLVATPNPLTLVKVAETFQRRSEEIIRSIHDGRLCDGIRGDREPVDAAIPADIKAWVKPNKARAAFLGAVLERTGSLKPSDCWPDLALIGCWLGGSIGFHVEALKPYFGDTPKRDIGYMASEGCMTLPFEDATTGGILALKNHFYEFIPEDQIDSNTPDILGVADLEEGACYKILLTNENGLFRYDINDIIHVDGFYHRAPVVSFVRKSGNMASIAGEKLHLNHVLSAVDKVQSRFGFVVNQFRVVPDPAGLRYEFYFDAGAEIPKPILGRDVLPALDECLCETNMEYASRRRSGRLNAPLLHVMVPSWAETSRQAHGQFGQRDVQHKWVQMAPSKIETDHRHILYTIE